MLPSTTVPRGLMTTGLGGRLGTEGVLRLLSRRPSHPAGASTLPAQNLKGILHAGGHLAHQIRLTQSNGLRLSLMRDPPVRAQQGQPHTADCRCQLDTQHRALGKPPSTWGPSRSSLPLLENSVPNAAMTSFSH